MAGQEWGSAARIGGHHGGRASRRVFLCGCGGALAGLVLGACGGSAPPATQPVPTPELATSATRAVAHATGCAGPGCGATATVAPGPAALAPTATVTSMPSPTPVPLPPPTPVPPTSVPSTVATSPSIAPTAQPLYRADFTRDWFTGEKGAPFPYRASTSPQPAPWGEYRLTLTEAGRAYSVFQLAPEGLRFGDCRIDVDLRRIAGPDLAACGLAFRIQPGIANAESYERYQLAIVADGTWLLSHIPAVGNGTALVARSAAPAIKKGDEMNHLTILCRDAQLVALINGQQVGAVVGPIGAPGMVAPYVGMAYGIPPTATAEAAFSNLVISPLG